MDNSRGVATSEFWSMAALVCALLGAALPATIAYVPEGSIAWVIMSIVISVTGAVMSYIKSRGLAKVSLPPPGSTPNPPQG